MQLAFHDTAVMARMVSCVPIVRLISVSDSPVWDTAHRVFKELLRLSGAFGPALDHLDTVVDNPFGHD